MRKSHIKKGYQKTPKIIADMGLSDEYQKFVKDCIERDKTHEIIWVKNPEHYKCPAYKVDIWRKTEDLFFIYAETMFGKKEIFAKEDLYNYVN
jgi:hypothetical protein